MSAAQIQIILSNVDSFSGLIGQTLSADNATRRNAEDLYAQLKRQRPDACATILLQLMRTTGDARVRATCAVFLRKFFKPGHKEAGWDQLNGSTKALAKRELLAALDAEVDRTTAKQIADAIVELGQQILAGKKAQSVWSELLTSLQQWLQGGSSAVAREAALQVAAGLALHLRSFSGQLAPVVTGCLGPQNDPAVQLAALQAVTSYLEVLRKPVELRPYQAALAGGLTALQGMLAAGHMDAAEKTLVALIRTAECEPGMWQPHVRTAVPGMLALAGPAPGSSAPALPEGLRKLAAEFVMTLTDIKPQMMQGELGAGPLAAQLVACFARFLVSGVEDDESWGSDPMASPDMPEDETMGDLHQHGLECATRAADALDSAAVLRAVVDMTTAWARDGSDWRRRHAVLLCLSQVIGSCKEVVGEGELASLAALLADSLRDPHPRVRWAACHAVGVLSDELGPGLQLQSGGGGSALLRGLAELLVQPESPVCPQRVKAQACRALVGFLEGLEKDEAEEAVEGGKEALGQRVRELLCPFLEPLSGPLLAAVQRCAAGEGGAVAGGSALVPTPLQEFSLDVLTHLAVCLGKSFAPIFPAAMPHVLAVLGRAAPFHAASATASGSVTEEEASAIVRVQVGALECAAFMCRAVGPGPVAEHVPALAALLGLLARPDLEPASPLLVPLLGAVEPLVACLGAEMRHLLGPVLPLLVQWASKDVGLQNADVDDEDAAEDSEGADGSDAKDSDSDADSDDRDDSDVAYLSYDGCSYRCSSSILAAKAAAVSALEELADKMGPALAPQAPLVAEALVPRLLEYPLDEVHLIARRSLPVLLRNYLAALTSGVLPPSDPAASPATAQAVLHRIWQALTAAINPESVEAPLPLQPPSGTRRPAPTSSTRADMVEVLTRVVDCVEGSMLQQSWVAEAFGALQAALAAVQAEAQADGTSDSDEEEDKSMEGDGSVDLEAEGSGADDEDDEEEEEDDSEEAEESPEAARERLRAQVEACVAAFTRKYGDAVAAMAQQVLAAQRPEQQREAVVAVRNGMVA
ncbi:hypothetical protein Agub_g14447 [Astrephomene gubernaculifera]|uniref:IPO4/5-like TPR repeats domain-containing protein n=1 Tax=Astrephomene gubernaculifera TaxID=47775 RepID=A0AAD3HSZ6_9CHLO|nr:hypothetical protein Agub_g14447 [Astrephomene gubernaculifera]